MPLLHKSLTYLRPEGYPWHVLLMVMGEIGNKLSSMSIFQAFFSIMSINIPLARPSHMVKPSASEARKYSPPIEAGNVKSQRRVWTLGGVKNWEQ